MKAIIFAGGVGTRLWPLSRKKSPKQFEKIVGDQSTLQLAASRLQPDFLWSDVYISTGKQYVELVKKQLPHVASTHVIGEPQVRDVGPAVGLMSAILLKESPLEPMVILWSDHLVKKEELFRKLLITAGEVISKDPQKIVFVSQKPRFASENLGWISYGKKIEEHNGVSFHSLEDYQYRPDVETAQKYFVSGHHAWNLGYFVTTPAFLWKQYQKFAPNLASGIQKIANTYGTKEFETVLSHVYPTLEKISFDNAILEKMNVKDSLVVTENIEWSDIGAWEALKESLETSDDKNVTQGNVMLTDVQDSLVYNYTDQLVATIDLDGIMVVNTKDVLLICKKTSVPKVKKLVESMQGTDNDHLT
ncbi:MAG: sugar phosphate nucleotidyltransferase [Patescibacteria group bacterium]